MPHVICPHCGLPLVHQVREDDSYRYACPTGDWATAWSVSGEEPEGAFTSTGSAIYSSGGGVGDIVVNAPAGPPGPTGPAGPQGSVGPAGPNGLDGASGPQGPTGPAGSDGRTFTWRGIWDNTTPYTKDDLVYHDGTSYIATANTPTIGDAPDTSAEWDEFAVSGQTGPQGPQGEQGPIGPLGPTGEQGPIGPAGPQGVQGLKGDTGNTGPTGPVGPQGVKGDTGNVGPIGPIGNTGPSGPRGINWKGAWASGTAYVLDDGVTHLGNTFRATTAIASGGAAPDVNASWELVAKKGDKGDPGAAGVTTVATTTSQGTVRITPAPAMPTDPIAVGDNDTRLTNARTPTAHTHVKADITDFAHTHPFTDVSGSMSSAQHGDLSTVDTAAARHHWNQITNKPTTFAPTAHTHVKADITDFAHTHTKSQITDFAHTHVKADITDFAHTHGVADLTATGTRDATTILYGDNTWKTAPSGGGGGVTVVKKSADQAFTLVTLADITDFAAISVPANTAISIDLNMVFSSAATTTGFQFALTPATGFTPTRFLAVFEWQSTATAWTTFTQTVATTPMTMQTASYVANSGILIRCTAQVEAGATGGTLKFQGATEVAASAITVRKGSTLRIM